MIRTDSRVQTLDAFVQREEKGGDGLETRRERTEGELGKSKEDTRTIKKASLSGNNTIDNASSDTGDKLDGANKRY
jgi:hypothetical protein